MRLRVILVLSVLVLAWLACGSWGGPEWDALKSFCVVVPEFSETSGGFSPAVSADGKTLAFMSSPRGLQWRASVCILHDEQLGRAIVPVARVAGRPEPWELVLPEIQPKDYVLLLKGGQAESRMRATDVRRMDWSRDGRLAFVSGIQLFVADGFDYASKTAKPRVVAQGVNPADYPLPQDMGRAPEINLESPRWSPDGSKIAYIRDRVREQSASLCVLDIQSGKETVLAEDAVLGPGVYSQPWSPDGELLVYARKSSVMPYRGNGVSVVSVDGKEHREVVPQSKYGLGNDAASPSWSPTSDSIAFCMHVLLERSSDEEAMTVANLSWPYLTDSHGAKPVYAIRPRQPSKVEYDAVDKRCRLDAGRRIVARYKAQLSQEEQTKLLSGEMSPHQMGELVRLCIVRIIGGDFQRLVEEHAKTGKEDRDWISTLSKALRNLPKEQSELYNLHYFDDIQVAIQPCVDMIPSGFSGPISWSGDGARIALVRLGGTDMKKVVVIDIPDGIDTTLFTSASIKALEWMPGGRSLMVGMSRWMAHTDGSMAFGYPEIWYLEMK